MHVGTPVVHRRTLLTGTVLGTALAFSPAFYRAALAAPVTDGPGPYGPLQEPDENGVQLPAGFTSRVVAVSGTAVAGSSYVWHTFPDGAACFPEEDGSYRYVCNSEVPGGQGGVGAILFGADGEILDAYGVLSGTSTNCAGGPTPWGTWLSCEENGDDGEVYECAPDGSAATVLPALGQFNHEAVAVDPDEQVLYLTEDTGDGCFYRFLPTAYPDLTAGGQLQAAQLDGDGRVTWLDVAPESSPTPVRQQQPDATRFDGGEGIWFDQVGPGEPGYVYFTTKGDDVVWVLDIAANTITKLYDAADFDEPVLDGVDNVTVAPSGDVLVAEDGGNLEINLISADDRTVSTLMRLPGAEHAASEITGPCFSPDGTRLYFSSQRGGLPLAVPGLGGGIGVTFEITGPFRLERVGIAGAGIAADPTPQPAPEEPVTEPAPDEPAPTGGDNDAAPDADGPSLPATGGGAAALGTAAVVAATALRRSGRMSPVDAPDDADAPGTDEDDL